MKRLVCVLVAVAAAVALAGVYLPSSAATVGGTTITRQALDSDLSAIAGSPDFTCFLSEERQLSSGGSVPFLGAGTANAKGGVYDASAVDDWLDSMITDQVTKRLVASHGLRVTPADLTVARGVLSRRIEGVLGTYARDAGLPAAACGGSGQTVLSSLPQWFVREQTTADAEQFVLDAHAAGSGLSTSAVAAYFSRHRRLFDRVCLDAVVLRSSAAAEQVETALSDGASFAHEAQSASVTASTAANDGKLGCGVIVGSFFATAVDKVAVGGVTQPVHAGDLYLVIRLAKATKVALGSVRGDVVTTIIRAGQARADAEVASALRATSVGVDPRYGTAASQRLTLLRAAPSPPASDEISNVANRPTLTAASS